MFKRKYYVVTASEGKLGLSVYYLGKFRKKELVEFAEKLNREFPVFFVIISGWRIRQVISNMAEVQYAQQPTVVPTTVPAKGQKERLVN